MQNVTDDAFDDQSAYVSVLLSLGYFVSSCGLNDLCQFVLMNTCISSLELATSNWVFLSTLHNSCLSYCFWCMLLNNEDIYILFLLSQHQCRVRVWSIDHGSSISHRSVEDDRSDSATTMVNLFSLYVKQKKKDGFSHDNFEAQMDFLRQLQDGTASSGVHLYLEEVFLFHFQFFSSTFMFNCYFSKLVQSILFQSFILFLFSFDALRTLHVLSVSLLPQL